RDEAVQRLMFLSLRHGDCRIQLTVNTQGGKRSKRRLPVFLIPLDRLEQPQHSFLDQVLLIASGKIERARLLADKVFILVHQIVRHLALPVSYHPETLFILFSLIFSCQFILSVLQSHKPPLPPQQKHSAIRFLPSSESSRQNHISHARAWI